MRARLHDNDIELVNLNPLDDKLIDLFEFKRSPIMQFYKYLGTTGAEWNYAIGMPLNAAVLAQSIPSNAGLGLTLGWNYLDAVYAIGLGTFQLLDEEDYRQTQNKAKGILNIISGVQLFLLSYNPPLAAALGLAGGAALAAPAFALAMACELVSASIDFYNAEKEVKFEGWLEERAKEISYDRIRISELGKKITKPDNKKAKLEIEYLEAKKRKLETKIQTIEKDIYARSRVYCDNDPSQNKSRKVENILNKYDPEGNTQINDELKKEVTPDDIKSDKQIQKTLTESYKENRDNLALKTASFVGMTLLAVSGFVSCPPLLIIGLCITAVVAGIYIHRNSKKIIETIDGVTSKFGLFNAQKDKTIAFDKTNYPTLSVNSNAAALHL